MTGGIATGKSHVLDEFRRRGVPCLDADALAHGVTAAGTEATAAIAARFGAEILAPDGAVDRAKLGPIVFADPSARRELEAIVHPAVYRAIAAGLRAFELHRRRSVRRRRHPAAVRNRRGEGLRSRHRDGVSRRRRSWRGSASAE